MPHNTRREPNILQGERALSLVELVIILAVFAVFTAVAVARYNSLSRQADEATVKAFTSILRAAATITYANIALGNVPDCTIKNITIKSVYDNLEDKGGIQLDGDTAFTATINGKKYRWHFKPPLTVEDGVEY
jgi:type II secretory pathway pseudopilin PulG